MEEVPLLKALHGKYASEAVLLGISIDTDLQRTDRTIKEKGMVWPVLADGKGFDGPIPKAYHIQGTPDIWILDRAGKILARPGSAKQIDAILGEALAPRGPGDLRRPSRRTLSASGYRFFLTGCAELADED